MILSHDSMIFLYIYIPDLLYQFIHWGKLRFCIRLLFIFIYFYVTVSVLYFHLKNSFQQFCQAVKPAMNQNEVQEIIGDNVFVLYCHMNLKLCYHSTLSCSFIIFFFLQVYFSMREKSEDSLNLLWYMGNFIEKLYIKNGY